MTPTPSQKKISQTAAERHRIFEQVALERLRSGEDQTKPVGFLPLPVRATALSAIMITLGGVLWSVLARVPVQVNGIGLIIPEGTISSVQANVNGIIHYQVSGAAPNRLPQAQQQDNLLLQRYWNDPNLYYSRQGQADPLFQLTEVLSKPPASQQLFTTELLRETEQYDNLNRPAKAAYIPPGVLIAIIPDVVGLESLKSSAREAKLQYRLLNEQMSSRQSRLQILEQLQQKQSLQLNSDKATLENREKFLANLRQIWQSGAIPTNQLLAEQERVNSFRNQILSTDRSRIETGLQQTDQRNSLRQDRSQIRSTLNKLETQLSDYVERSYIFAPNTGVYLIGRSARNLSAVRSGEELFIYSRQPPYLPSEIPVFLSAAEAAQVQENMDVLVTPSGISRAQYGGIRGKVTSVSKVASLNDNIIAATGFRSAAGLIAQRIQVPFLAKIRLDQEDRRYCNQPLSKRCYSWSSGQIPPHPVRIGNQADVQITTIYRRPIDFVIPALRKVLGLEVDNQ